MELADIRLQNRLEFAGPKSTPQKQEEKKPDRLVELGIVEEWHNAMLCLRGGLPEQ